ncbi:MULTISPECIES: hypothetical protein [Microbacterium]|uniref:Uncharacterized protein n=1 Tax=Microbacterium hominis TaxID=162426 RepID=A0A2K9D9U3_9MICO|nr:MULTISPECIES: hypothetical protein [Microbacterium]AUG30360.1 hypothetical protein CXR34_13490 [Microbacterium hominis]
MPSLTARERRAFFTAVTGAAAPKPSLPARIIGGAITVGIVALAAALLVWGLAAVIVGIARTLGAP